MLRETNKLLFGNNPDRYCFFFFLLNIYPLTFHGMTKLKRNLYPSVYFPVIYMEPTGQYTTMNLIDWHGMQYSFLHIFFSLFNRCFCVSSPVPLDNIRWYLCFLLNQFYIYFSNLIWHLSVLLDFMLFYLTKWFVLVFILFFKHEFKMQSDDAAADVKKIIKNNNVD